MSFQFSKALLFCFTSIPCVGGEPVTYVGSYTESSDLFQLFRLGYFCYSLQLFRPPFPSLLARKVVFLSELQLLMLLHSYNQLEFSLDQHQQIKDRKRKEGEKRKFSPVQAIL